MRLKDKVCAITGAGSGIGESAAKIFAREGARIAVLEINEDAGQRVASEIGDAAVFIKTDVSDPGCVEAAFKQIDKQFGRLDGLYNNASIFLGDHDAKVTDLDLDVYHKIVSINQHSVVYCCKFAIPMMINSPGGGSIVNTASSAAISGIPGCDSYTATKGATVTLTRSMAVEYAPQNVRVNSIAPSGIYTPMIRESNLNDPNFDEQAFLDKTPLRRWGQPEDVAHTALFLTSDEAKYVTGTMIVVDGAITIMPSF
jgi:NAD(P)-dependent dehydrogenase (short-subunit alcohol dehydrogenase family)